MRVRKICLAILPALCLSTLSCGSAAQEQGSADKYPSKPIRWIVPSSAGGGNDALARLIGSRMTQNWGQQMIVDLRPGASGIIGMEIAARSPADGYTLLIVASGYVLNPLLKAKLPYDTFNDFQRITVIAYSPNVLVVHPSMPIRSVAELVAFAKKRPNVVNYASSGAGTIGSLAAAMLTKMSDTKMVEVPYKGAGDSGRAVVAGEVHINLNAPSVLVPFIKSGRLRGLGVTSPKRMSIIPDVPTISETLPGYELQNFFGLLTPAKTPPAIVEKLHGEMVRILSLPDIRAILEEQGFIPGGNTPEEFTAYVRNTSVQWGRLLQDTGSKPQ